MGKRSRDKGARREREACEYFRSVGINAQRVPLSGSAGGDFCDDVLCKLEDWLFRCEVKARAEAQGWVTIKKWLGNSDMLMLIEDRTKPLVVQCAGLLVVPAGWQHADALFDDDVAHAIQ